MDGCCIDGKSRKPGSPEDETVRIGIECHCPRLDAEAFYLFDQYFGGIPLHDGEEGQQLGCSPWVSSYFSRSFCKKNPPTTCHRCGAGFGPRCGESVGISGASPNTSQPRSSSTNGPQMMQSTEINTDPDCNRAPNTPCHPACWRCSLMFYSAIAKKW